MTDYEILSLVIAVIGLLIGAVTLLLKLLAYLDTRYANENFTRDTFSMVTVK